jgi:hypothetical protein
VEELTNNIKLKKYFQVTEQRRVQSRDVQRGVSNEKLLVLRCPECACSKSEESHETKEGRAAHAGR